MYHVILSSLLSYNHLKHTDSSGIQQLRLSLQKGSVLSLFPGSSSIISAELLSPAVGCFICLFVSSVEISLCFICRWPWYTKMYSADPQVKFLYSWVSPHSFLFSSVFAGGNNEYNNKMGMNNQLLMVGRRCWACCRCCAYSEINTPKLVILLNSLFFLLPGSNWPDQNYLWCY